MTVPVSVRLAQPTDAPWLAELTGTADAFNWTLSGTTDGWWVAEADGAPIGLSFLGGPGSDATLLRLATTLTG